MKADDPVLTGPQTLPIPAPFTEIASKFRVIELDKDQYLPTLKKGMYVLLEGKLSCTTHWNKKEGHTVSQKNYLKYIKMQQGKRIEDYARESRSKANSTLESEKTVTNVSTIT